MTKASSTQKKKFLPYGRQYVTEEDIDAVVKVLRSDWLTQGPMIPAFEQELCRVTGAEHAVVCSSGTAALHLAMMALEIGPGDTVVTTANTFLADANCARFVGADVAFTDIDPETGNMSPDSLKKLLHRDKQKCIKAVIPVHFAGQPVELTKIAELAEDHGAAVVDDACHALGASYEYQGKTIRLGNSPHSKMTVLSFHPVKHVAMGEGGAITTSDAALAERLNRFRNHGIIRENFSDSTMALAPDGTPNPWYYEMPSPAPNYRITDIQAALGLSQLKRLEWSVIERNRLAELYRRLLKDTFPDSQVEALKVIPAVRHAYHLFVVRIEFESLHQSRASVMTRLKEAGIGTQVHYIPVPFQPYYRKLLGLEKGDFPGAREYYSQALSLPMYPGLENDDVHRVVDELKRILNSPA